MKSDHSQIRKILYVHYQVSERDGSHTHTRSFHQAFGALCRERGIRFQVVAPRLVSTDISRPGPWQRFKSSVGPYYLHDVKTLLLQYKRTMGERRLLAAEQPDIVLTRFDGDTLSIIWACRALGIPVVLEINAPEVELFNRHFRHIPGIAGLFTNHHALSLAQGAFAVSDSLIHPLSKQVCGRKPFITIPNGVDTEHFDPASPGNAVRDVLGVPPACTLIGFVGSFAPWHGLPELLYVFRDLVRQQPDLHLLLVGQPRPDSRELIKVIRSPPLASYITLTGFVPFESIPAHLAAIDIAVLPHSEPYCSPLKLFEYMAMGKPTVAVATDPIASVMRDGREGVLFSPGDTEGMSRAILRLVRTPELAERFGSNARRRVQDAFSWRHNAQRVLTLLERVYLLNR